MFHVRKIGYFGSYATGRQTEQNDLELFRADEYKIPTIGNTCALAASNATP